MNKIYFTADLGLNHNSNFKRACDLIFQAKQCGFDAVKFQLYDADRLTSNPDTRELLKAAKFDPEWLPELREFCGDLQIDLAVTPFYPEAVEVIKPYVDWIKIGSHELNYLELLDAVCESGLPIVASAGFVKNPDKIYIRNLKTLLYCVPKYPCTVDDIDMNWIIKAKQTGYSIGYSDHSHKSPVIWAAIMAGADHIELHFDSDGNGLEYHMGHVWLAHECRELIGRIKSALKCFEPTLFIPDYSKQTDKYGRRK